MIPREDKPPGIQLSMKIDFGQILIFVGMIVTVTGVILTSSLGGSQNTKDITALRADLGTTSTALRTDMTTSSTALRADMNAQFALVRQDISNLPNVSAQLTQMGKTLDQDEGRISAIDTRLREVESRTAGLRSEMDSMKRASDLPLPTRGGR